MNHEIDRVVHALVARGKSVLAADETPATYTDEMEVAAATPGDLAHRREWDDD